MIWARSERRLVITAGLLVLLFVGGVVLASRQGLAPRPRAIYRGSLVMQTAGGGIRQRLALSFAIDATGGRVLAPGLDGLPSRCGGRGLARVRIGAGSAPIRTPSRFELTVPLLVGRRRVGALTLSGSFETLGRVSGAAEDRFSVRGLRACGTSGGYTARSG